jgi:CubicO group peptidase (beta-lactamase class C family)
LKNEPLKTEGMSSKNLPRLIRYSNSLSDAGGLLLIKHDKIVVEHYQSSTAAVEWDIQSATKSFGAAILAVALDDGALTLDDPVCGRPDMTIHHLASMSAGFPKPSDISCDTDLLFSPGSDFAYSDGGVNIMGQAIMRALKIADIEHFMKERILAPIGAMNWSWDGRFSAGLRMTIRDMARYGRLWLRRGDWDGKRIFSENCARLATRAANPDLMKSYGYLWWVNTCGESQPYEKYGFKLNPVFDRNVPSDAFMAIGASFSFILVIPSLDLVAARSGSGFHSIQSGDTRLTDESRRFVDAVLTAVKGDP